MEFADPSLVANAMSLDNSLLRGRAIKVITLLVISYFMFHIPSCNINSYCWTFQVTAKRTNIPGYTRGGRGGRGARASWRGGYYGGHSAYYPTAFRGRAR